MHVTTFDVVPLRLQAVTCNVLRISRDSLCFITKVYETCRILALLSLANGRERVVSANGRPVVGLRPRSPFLEPRGLGTGAGPAAGVEVNAELPVEAALTKARLKAELIRALAEQGASGVE